ncbi:MAG TPA: DUF488 domain-containing protein [Allosphingosinicella sp.]|jgi:uncharacterized protein (DUF488 family)
MSGLCTIGYSGQNKDSFTALLKAHAVDVVCDVRSTPYSSYKPDFSRGPFRKFLNEARIKYVFMGDQLGARPKDRSCYVGGQARYDRIAQASFFREGLDRIRSGVRQLNLALVCSETDPLECHRAVLICRNLPELWGCISHIHSDGRLETQEEFDDRLVNFHRLAPPPLLRQPSDWQTFVLHAYEKQADAIAYRERDWEKDEERVG